MRKPNKSKRLRKKKVRKNRQSSWHNAVRIETEQRNAQLNEYRYQDFLKKIK